MKMEFVSKLILIFFVSHLFGVSTREIRVQVATSLKTLLEKR